MYYSMHIDFADPILSKYPKAAKYDNKTIVLTGEMPSNFTGEIVRICDERLTGDELIASVDILRNEVHTGKLIILSNSQGRYLYANHEAFKPEIN